MFSASAAHDFSTDNGAGGLRPTSSASAARMARRTSSLGSGSILTGTAAGYRMGVAEDPLQNPPFE
jgi:hypothetical protein